MLRCNTQSTAGFSSIGRSIFAILWTLCASPSVHAELKLYETKYYNIYTDIDPDEEKEAAIRMTKMAEEYHQRTADFAGQIREKLPFYLYKSPADYYRAGGLQGSAGVFMAIGSGGKLMALAGRKGSTQTWHTVQHEGFHQFVHQVMGGDFPVWLNEGLAEYFGESIFTGDGFVTGVIPPWRLSRLKGELTDHQLRSFGDIMHLTGQEWADQLNIKNYDQAWSMVYFLVHGDDQKYVTGLTRYIRQISQGTNADTAWNDTLAGSGELEERWRNWWLAQPQSPTTTLYGRAAVATMTSFIARAFAAGQTFDDFDAFRSAVNESKLKMNPDDWLPMSLINDAFRLYGNAPKWELQSPARKQPTLSLTLGDGTRVTGTFMLTGKRVSQVKVEVDELAPVLKEAQTLVDQGKKEQAKQRVLTAIRTDPNSPMIPQARKFLQGLR
jgi:hypothetical protein